MIILIVAGFVVLVIKIVIITIIVCFLGSLWNEYFDPNSKLFPKEKKEDYDELEP